MLQLFIGSEGIYGAPTGYQTLEIYIWEAGKKAGVERGLNYLWEVERGKREKTKGRARILSV